jgi:hypothetical protein
VVLQFSIDIESVSEVASSFEVVRDEGVEVVLVLEFALGVAFHEIVESWLPAVFGEGGDGAVVLLPEEAESVV